MEWYATFLISCTFISCVEFRFLKALNFQCTLSDKTKNTSSMARLSIDEYARAVGILEICGCNVKFSEKGQ